MKDRIKYWQCPNCGQLHFGDEPPDICDYCQDFTTWRLLRTGESPDPRADANENDSNPRDNHRPSQRRLFDD